MQPTRVARRACNEKHSIFVTRTFCWKIHLDPLTHQHPASSNAAKCHVFAWPPRQEAAQKQHTCGSTAQCASRPDHPRHRGGASAGPEATPPPPGAWGASANTSKTMFLKYEDIHHFKVNVWSPRNVLFNIPRSQRHNNGTSKGSQRDLNGAPRRRLWTSRDSDFNHAH